MLGSKHFYANDSTIPENFPEHDDFENMKNKASAKVLSIPRLKESIRKRIFGPVHIHLDVTVRVTNQIPTIYPIISTQSSIENYAKMRLESRRLSPYLFTCDVTNSLSD